MRRASSAVWFRVWRGFCSPRPRQQFQRSDCSLGEAYVKTSQLARVGKGVRSRSISWVLVLGVVSLVALQVTISSQSQSAHDPGVRGGDAGAGGGFSDLTAQQKEYFTAGKEEFEEADDADEGLGPRMDLDSCA